MIQEAIQVLMNQEDLPEGLTEASFNEIMSNEATPAQTAAFLMGLKIKGESPQEITECAKVMRDKCNPLETEQEVLEIVGTGGDQKGTFNISTASAIVCAAAGVPVAKHGNRSASSKCGAADVLEALDFNINRSKEESENLLKNTNFCFMFAPLYHSSMKYAAGVRKDMAIPTIFNILGPLANPAFADYQLLGVYDKELLMPMANVLKNLGIKRGLVVYGEDGLDEITLADKTDAVLIDNGTLQELEIDPKLYGLEYCNEEDLIGGNPEENAQIIRDIFDGKEPVKKDAVLLNSGAALFLAKKADSIQEGIDIARDIIDSGKAKEKLEEIINF